MRKPGDRGVKVITSFLLFAIPGLWRRRYKAKGRDPELQRSFQRNSRDLDKNATLRSRLKISCQDQQTAVYVVRGALAILWTSVEAERLFSRRTAIMSKMRIRIRWSLKCSTPISSSKICKGHRSRKLTSAMQYGIQASSRGA